jgi:hypothetical protein
MDRGNASVLLTGEEIVIALLHGIGKQTEIRLRLIF